MIQQTSIEAFEDIKPELGKRQLEVLNAFKYYGDHTNLELSNKTGIPINQLTPRTFELRKLNLVEEKLKRPCNVSGRTALVWGRVEQ